MKKDRKAFWLGLKNGIPLALGYFAVSFAFGVKAKDIGLSAFQAVLISATNLTSAGQFAGVDLIAGSVSYIEMAVAMFVINIRYCLMSGALSQKIDGERPAFHRFLVSFGITDEVFGISIAEPGKLNPFYSYGAISIALPGWTLGTLAGVISGGVLPGRIVSAISVAIFGMFIAIIVPPARKDKILAGLIAAAMIFSSLFYIVPLFKGVSGGLKIIIPTVLIAGLAAFLFPVKETAESEK